MGLVISISVQVDPELLKIQCRLLNKLLNFSCTHFDQHAGSAPGPQLCMGCTFTSSLNCGMCSQVTSLTPKNTQHLWQGFNTVAGYKPTDQTCCNDLALPDNLNTPTTKGSCRHLPNRSCSEGTCRTTKMFSQGHFQHLPQTKITFPLV